MNRAPAVSVAKRAYYAALVACPHWDLDKTGDGHPCCVALAVAEVEFHQAKREAEAEAACPA